MNSIENLRQRTGNSVTSNSNLQLIDEKANRNSLLNQKQEQKVKRDSVLFVDHSQLRKTVTMFVKRQILEKERGSSAESTPRGADRPSESREP